MVAQATRDRIDTDLGLVADFAARDRAWRLLAPWIALVVGAVVLAAAICPTAASRKELAAGCPFDDQLLSIWAGVTMK
jgi:hypothetical protein